VQKKAVTGILLAGGKSRRMGKDKGFLELDKRALYTFPKVVLEKTCSEIIISTCKPKGTFGEYPHVCDKKQDIGPLMGILTCLEQSSYEFNIILSYDMPLVDPRLINDLIELGNNHDLVIPALRIDQPQPLCGLYKKSLIPVIKNAFKKGITAPRKLIPLANSRIHVIDHSAPYFTEDMFININTQDDLIRITHKY